MTAGTKQVTTIILAGGQGSRLYPLTQQRSKPAVPIAGKFRLIDVPISNCIHANIRNMWIITQFTSESLHRHIFSAYQMDPFTKGFISILAASQTIDSKDWYEGTADAVRKNLRYFESAHDTIMILSGDHLYRMDYSEYIDFHWKHDADITVSVIPMPAYRVPELGVLKMDENLKIVDFYEKPNDPEIIRSFEIPDAVRQKTPNLTPAQTHMASMGIYLFKKDVLFSLLEANNDHDFGKQIIPKSIHQKKVFAYSFDGYWEDIGTIKSFFDVHISLTQHVPDFNFYDEEKPIYTHGRFLAGAKINEAKVDCSIISEGSIIDPSYIRHCVIGLRSVIHTGCHLEYVIMMGADFYEDPMAQNISSGRPRIGIGENTTVKNAILDKNVRIGRNVKLLNKDNVVEADLTDCYIREGIIVIPKGASIPDGFSV
ncbi:MAG: glucose-1-phosphate adenylyltransferase [SAR324 cluster bacterium]|nr:glucose-1-phosphate adenylyltransferase [SAR324 cluster bacterium]